MVHTGYSLFFREENKAAACFYMRRARIVTNTTTLPPETIEYLKSEAVRLHHVFLAGQDALTKLAAVCSMLKAEGIDIPETTPPIVILPPRKY